MENHSVLRKELFTTYKVHRFLIAEFFLIVLATIITPLLEAGHPGAKILTMGDSLWWTLVTATNTGYGDFIPVSLGGRVIATVLMFSGFALYSVSVGIFISFINRHRVHRNWQRTNLQFEELNKRLDRLEKESTFVVNSIAKK